MRTNSWFLTPLVVLLLIVPAIAQEEAGLSEADRLRLVDEGRSALHLGELDKALKRADKLLEALPGDTEAVLIKVSALQARGDYHQAEEALQAGFAAHNDRPARLIAREGQLDALFGRYDEARKAFEAALAKDSELLEPRLELARLLRDLHEREKAQQHLLHFLEYYQTASSLTPREFILIGRACVELDHYQEVKEEYSQPFPKYANMMFQQAADDPDAFLPELYYHWGQLFLDKYDYKESARLFRKALEMNPFYAEAQVGLARALVIDPYGGTEKYSKARDALKAAEATNPNLPGLRTAQAELFILDGDYEAALGALDKAFEVNPKHYDALSLKAAIHYLLRDKDSYDQVVAKVTSIYPQPAHFYWMIASTIEGKFLYRQAARFCKKAIMLDPAFWQAYATLGLNLVRVGDEDLGVEYLQRAFDNDPYNIWVFNTLELFDYMEKNFVLEGTEHFRIRMHREEVEAYLPYLRELLEEAYATLLTKYQVELDGKVLFELFKDLSNFSARSVGLPLIGASGVCFGMVVTEVSHQGFPPGTHNWGRTLWHEFAHVATLNKSDHRVPRWFTEGLSVYEEHRGRPEWQREWHLQLMGAMQQERLLPILELNSGFTRPRFPGQILLSYFQGGMICEFIEARWGFPKILEMLEGYKAGLETAGVIEQVLEVEPAEFDRAFMAFMEKRFERYTFRAPYTMEQAKRFQRESKEHPENVETLVKLGFAWVDLGKVADAETAVGRIKELDPQNPDAPMILAGVFDSRGNLAAAKEHYRKALELGTRDPFKAHLRLGQIAAEAKEMQTALEHYRQARDLCPVHPGILQVLIGLEQQLGNEDESLQAQIALAELNCKLDTLRYPLAKHFEEREDWVQAERWLEECLYINPFPPELHYRLGRAYRHTGKLEQAERELAMALILDYEDRAAVMLEQVEVSLAHNEPGAVERRLNQLLEEFPNYEPALELKKRLEKEK